MIPIPYNIIYYLLPIWICVIVRCSSLVFPGTASRPVLSDEEAETLTAEEYLYPWIPESIVVPDIANYVVSKNSTLASIQLAVNAAILDNVNGTGNRQFIFVTAGVYEETVFIPSDSDPITIYGEEGAKIVLNQDAGMSVEDWIEQVNPNNSRYKENDPAYSMFKDCAKSKSTIGTRCTAVVWIKSSNVQLLDIEIENSYALIGDAQAVALRVDSDRIHLARMRLLGHQDTFYVASGKVFVNNSYIEGDTDYVFGQGTAVFNNCTFKTLADRKNSGIIFAPKTASHNSFGFLIVNSILTSDEKFQNTSKVSLGRSWDSSEYIPDQSPNGQILIRESRIDDMINETAPWKEGIGSKRPFSGNVNISRDLNDNRFNRFWEFETYS